MYFVFCVCYLPKYCFHVCKVIFNMNIEPCYLLMENETHSTHHHQSKSIQWMINTENEALLIWRYVPSSGSSMGINYYYLFYSFMVSSAGSFELGHYFWEERKNMNKQWSGMVMMILTKTIITIMSRLCRQTFLFHWPAMPEDSLQIVSFISEITILSSGGW